MNSGVLKNLDYYQTLSERAEKYILINGRLVLSRRIKKKSIHVIHKNIYEFNKATYYMLNHDYNTYLDYSIVKTVVYTTTILNWLLDNDGYLSLNSLTDEIIFLKESMIQLRTLLFDLKDITNTDTVNINYIKKQLFIADIVMTSLIEENKNDKAIKNIKSKDNGDNV